MIPLQKKDYFDLSGGIQAETSLVNFQDNEFYELNNIIRSRESTLKTRKGRQCYGQKIGTTAIKEFDKYLTDSKQELIMSSNGKLYYSNNTTGISTEVSFNSTVSKVDNYDPTNYTVELTMGASHKFEVGDNVYITLHGSDYVWTVSDIDGVTVTVEGAIDPIEETLAPAVDCYGGRLSDTLLVDNAINIRVGDMLVLQEYSVDLSAYTTIDRHFKVLDVDTGVTPNTIQIDEEFYFTDSINPLLISVSERWEQFTYCKRNLADTITCSTDVSTANNTITSTTNLTNGWGVFLVPIGAGILPEPFVSGIKYFVINATSGPNTCKLAETEGGTAIDITSTGTGTFTLLSGYDSPTNNIFDASSTQPYASSTMLRDNLLITDGENEPLVYDGTEVSRMGFHELPDLYNSLTLVESGTGTVTNGVHKYIITFSRYDNNGELVESGITEYRQITASGTSNVAIPVPIIPYKFNNELMYNVEKCVVNVYKTEVDGLNFYRALEVDMKTLGNFQIESLTDVAGDIMRIKLYGSPDLTYINAHATTGDYVLIKNNKLAAANGVFRIIAKSTSNYTIDVTNAAFTATQAALANNRTMGNAIICIRDNISDASLVNNDLLYCNKDVDPENQPPVLAKYVSVWDNRCWMADGATYNEALIGIGTTITNMVAGDSIWIKCGSVEEVYELATTASGDVTITTGSNVSRVSIQGASVITDILQGICEAINSNPNGVCWAYYERVTGADTFVIRERQRNINPVQIKFKLATTANLSYFRVNNTFLSSSYNDTYISLTQDRYSSRVWFSKTAQGQSFVGTFGNASTEDIYWNDVFPDNGEVCTGIMPQPQMILVWKEDSTYKVFSTGINSYSVEIVDNNIGCIAPKSIVSLGVKAIFLSKFGVHSTDGFTVDFIGRKFRREWTKLSSSLISNSCAAHIAKHSQYWVTVPYNNSDSDATENNTTFVYDYENGAWYKWTNTPFTMYTKVNESDIINRLGDTQYMSGTDGQTYTVREIGDYTDYRDDSSPIESTIITKWFDFDDKMSRKMFHTIIFNMYQNDCPNNAEISYGYDFNEGFEYLSTITSESGNWGNFSYGRAPMGGALTLATVKQPLSPEKCFYVRFKLYNEEPDKIIELQGFSLEGKMLNTKAVTQADNQ